MENDYCDPQVVDDSPAPPRSVEEPLPKVKKQLPQRNVDAFWDSVCTGAIPA